MTLKRLTPKPKTGISHPLLVLYFESIVNFGDAMLVTLLLAARAGLALLVDPETERSDLSWLWIDCNRESVLISLLRPNSRMWKLMEKTAEGHAANFLSRLD